LITIWFCRYNPNAACLTFSGRRKDGRCITQKNDSRYNPNDPCLTDPKPDAVPVQPVYNWQRYQKFAKLGENEVDPNDSRYNGTILGRALNYIILLKKINLGKK